MLLPYTYEHSCEFNFTHPFEGNNNNNKEPFKRYAIAPPRLAVQKRKKAGFFCPINYRYREIFRQTKQNEKGEIATIFIFLLLLFCHHFRSSTKKCV